MPLFYLDHAVVTDALAFDFWDFRTVGRSTLEDFKLAAEAILPIINTTITDIKNQTYPLKGFLNIDVPVNVKENKVHGNIVPNI